jgi:hypothetical protein
MLTKTGAVDPAHATITWQLAATPTGGGTRTITVTGRVFVRNPGTAGTTIGNVVVRLDRKEANWSPVAYDVANASQGDAATTALVVDPTDDQADDDDDEDLPMKVDRISETAASGALTFTQGASTPLSLVPTVTIPPGGTLDLRFTATFNNTILNIPVGATLRANIKITSGNAGPGPRTVAALDIDGSGAISADEARVRSKGRNLGQHTLGQPTIAQPTVVLSDALSDITTTGTVTFSNPVFALGATSGTVSVNYNGGTSGGTITNCAHLTGTGVNLVACNTQNSAANGPHVWANGEVITYSESQWGELGGAHSVGLLMATNYMTVYAATFGLIEVGIPGAGLSLRFTSASAILSYLPASGIPGSLGADYLDPSTTESGVFGGDVLALRLNVDFSAAGPTLGSLGVPFGDLVICNPVGLPGLHGTTVSQFLGLANTLLGTLLTSPGTLDVVSLFTAQLTTSFNDGIVSQFARDHLALGSCP